MRTFLIAAAAVAVFTLSSTTFGQQQAGGTAAEAKAMLVKAVAAVKADKAKALDEFNKGEGGFLDRDLYVFCANASDGKIIALANQNAKQLIGTDQRALKDLPAKRMAMNSTLRHRNRKVNSLKSPICFQGRARTRHQLKR